MQKRWLAILFILVLLSLWVCVQVRTVTASPRTAKLQFEVSIAPNLVTGAQNGRLFVVMDARKAGEPRFAIGRTGLDAPPVLAHDVSGFAPGTVRFLDQR